MNRVLLITLCLCSYISIFSQIEGNEVVCPGNIFSPYTFDDDSCEDIVNIEWSFEYDGLSGFSIVGGGQSIYLGWSALGGGPDNASLIVTYDCIDSEGNVTQKELVKYITILVINEPITTTNHINLVCNEMDKFTIQLTPQPGNATYAVSKPDCFEFVKDGLNLIFTPDKAESGEICITIKQPSCGTEKTHCITVTRDCEEILVFSNTSPIENSYNSVHNYINASNVSTVTFAYEEFKAGKHILLNPGFEADKVFLAHIGLCSCLPDNATGCLFEKVSPTENQDGFNDIEFTNSDVPVLGNTRFEIDSKIEGIVVYPNPTTGKGKIVIENYNGDDNYKVIIRDVLGQVIGKDNIKKEAYEFDLTNQNSGIYFVEIKYAGNTKVIKVLKTN